MFKRHNHFFLGIQVAVDGALISASWWLASRALDLGWLGKVRPPLYLKTDDGLIFGALSLRQLELELLRSPHLVATALLLVCFWRVGAYKSFRNDSRFSDFWVLMKGMASFAIPTWFISTLRAEWWVAWQFAACLGGLTFTSITFFRLIERYTLKYLRSMGYNQRHLLIVGARRNGQELVHKIRRCRWMGFNVVGFVDDGEDLQGHSVLGLPVLGRIADLSCVLETHNIDQVYCTLPFNEMDKTLTVANILTRYTTDLRVVPDLVSLSTLNASLFEIEGMPVLGVRETPLQGLGGFQKRIFDLAFSLCAITLLSPLFLILAIAIKCTTRGSIFYQQKRLGLGGREFRILKFRTMAEDAEKETGPVWSTHGDARRTPLGIFLRRTSLDELPQFFNVLAGTMSVVGPRPERPEFVGSFTNEIPNYMLRHKTKAGITGWAQVNGWRGDTSIRKRVQYDLYYIEHWSLWFDLRIIVDTIFRGLIHKNAH